MATKKNVKAVDYNDAEAIKDYCENDVAVCDDWKVRLKQEYVELKERLGKLHRRNVKTCINNRTQYDITPYNALTDRDKMAAAKERTSDELLNEQEEAMIRYKRVLEERMTLEGIEW